MEHQEQDSHRADAAGPFDSDQYYKTVWTIPTEVGKGFQSETNEYFPSAIRFEPEPVDNPARLQSTSSPQSEYSVVNSAHEFSEMTSMGGTATVEGWGASVSAVYGATNSMEYRSNSITVTFRMSHISDEIDVVPADNTGSVTLTEDAKKILREKGPVEFNKEHGSHFVKGCTFGALHSHTISCHVVLRILSTAMHAILLLLKDKTDEYPHSLQVDIECLLQTEI